jgi:TRAP-type transport system small permease protein
MTKSGIHHRQDAHGVPPLPPAPRLVPAVRWVGANLEEIGCALLLALLVGAVAAGVLFRYGFDAPLSWPEELSRFALVWLTFLGASMAAKRQGHIVVDFVGMFLPTPIRLWVVCVVHVAVLGFLGIFTLASLPMVQKMWVSVSTALSLRMSYVYVCIPVASSLMMIHTARQLWETARALRAAGGR